MLRMFRVTYEIVTPESAEIGDVAEHGFITPGDWQSPIEEALKEPLDTYNVTLREAMRLAYPQEDCGRWWLECDGRLDYRTGAVETRAIHPPHNITPSSYARVSRIYANAIPVVWKCSAAAREAAYWSGSPVKF